MGFFDAARFLAASEKPTAAERTAEIRRRYYIIMSNIFKDKKLRNDILLAAAVLLIAGGFWAFTSLTKTEGQYAAVIVNGTETARYLLSEDREILLKSENGGFNRLLIKDGKADITEASCPDKICVNQHAISKTGEAITCLPNKTVIEIVGGNREVDIVS